MPIQFCAALPLAIIATAMAVTPVRAYAQAPVASEVSNEVRRPAGSVYMISFVPGAVAAEAGPALATGHGWAGYDGATSTPLVGATAEVRLGARLVVGAGSTYSARDGQDRAELRPGVFARYQILDHAHHGVDVGAALAYRQDRFVTEEGMIQATLSLGMRGDSGAVLVNLGYGQDGEGDDHMGNARLVALRHVGSALHVGLDGSIQWLFDSTDPDRTQHGTPMLELTVAPAIAYGVGAATLTLEVGWSGVDFDHFRSGVLAISGIGTSF